MNWRGLLLCLSAWSVDGQASETLRYDWHTSGRVTGSLRVTVHEDGSRASTFEYRDRGRGPRLKETVSFDERDRVRRLHIQGHAYMGTTVDERFEREGAQARWWTTQEKGDAGGADEAVYLVSEGSPEQTAILARALLDAPQGQRAVLPAGEATIAVMDSVLIGPPGKTRHATLYAISGLDLTPTYIWLDARRELLAFTGGGFGLVPSGWTAFLPMLAERQQQAERNHAAALATTLTRTLPAEYAIENIHLVDVRRGRVRKNRVVVVREGRISSIGKRLPDDFTGHALDGAGGWLIPGLWDMHVHLGLADGMQHIAGGVTSVRDLGNNPSDLLQVREAFESGAAIGPGVIAAGVVDGKSPYSAPIGALPDSEAQALGLVRDYAQLGYAQVKIYSSVDPRWVPAIAAETHRLGMRLSGHIPNGMTAEQAVLAGFDEIQHINMLFLNFLAGPEVDTRTPARFTVVADHAAALDLDSAPVSDFLELLARRETVIDPTVAVFENMFTQAPGQVAPGLAMVANRFPPGLRRQLLSARMNDNASQAKARGDDFRALLSMLGRLHRRGIPIVAGTDGMPGFTLHRELELYAQAGIEEAEVLRLATLGAAEIMGLDDELGSIEAGKRADMVLLGGDPQKNISALRLPRLVVSGQRAWDPARLHDALGIRAAPAEHAYQPPAR